MISEIPDPNCVGTSSPLLSRIQNARAEFDARYTPTGSFQTANVAVTMTGVGFFDFLLKGATLGGALRYPGTSF
jgi:hypothetical protein